MPAFSVALKALIEPMDRARHAVEIRRLQQASSMADLDQISRDAGGWLTPGEKDPRLKLVKHGVGTFLVVEYKDGWSSRVSMADFHR